MNKDLYIEFLEHSLLSVRNSQNISNVTEISQKKSRRKKHKVYTNHRWTELDDLQIMQERANGVPFSRIAKHRGLRLKQVTSRWHNVIVKRYNMNKEVAL